MSMWFLSRCGRSWELRNEAGRILGYVARSLFGDWVAVAGNFAIAKGDDPEPLRKAVDARLAVQGAPDAPVLARVPLRQHRTG